MSVLIRDMNEIPEDGAVLVVKHDDDGKVYIKYAGIMGYSMELVKLPEKHGRLVDIDELSKKMYHDAFESDADLQKWDSGCWIRYKMFENNIDDVPTVIEAEGERWKNLTVSVLRKRADNQNLQRQGRMAR